MSDPGYVYLLVNPSMDGLIKIGKTNRSPEERANELSKATGVATPFLVVYKEFFDDCSQAESFVHTQLEQQNYRVASNREFFNAPVDIGVKMIIEAKHFLGISTGDLCDESYGEPESLNQSALDLENDLIAQGDKFYYGEGECLQDFDEAITFYKKAYKLSSAAACQRLGQIYAGEDGYRDSKLAIQYYKEGITRGNFFCYTSLAEIYCANGSLDNAIKCWNNFHQGIKSDSFPTHMLVDAACSYLRQSKVYNLPLTEKEFWLSKLPDIEKHYDDIIRNFKESNNINAAWAENDKHYAIYALSGKFSSKRHVGKVKWYAPEKGFGFIFSNNNDYYIHQEEIRDNSKSLQEGQNVSFGITPTIEGPCAHTVIIETETPRKKWFSW